MHYKRLCRKPTWFILSLFSLSGAFFRSLLRLDNSITLCQHLTCCDAYFMLWQQQQKQPEGSSKSNNNNKKQTQQTLAYLVAYFCGSLQYATFISRVRVAKGRWEQGEREQRVPAKTLSASRWPKCVPSLAVVLTQHAVPRNHNKLWAQLSQSCV